MAPGTLLDQSVHQALLASMAAPSLRAVAVSSYLSAGSAASPGAQCICPKIFWSSRDKGLMHKALLCPQYAPPLLQYYIHLIHAHGNCCMQRRQHFIHPVVHSHFPSAITFFTTCDCCVIIVSGRDGSDRGQTLHLPWSTMTYTPGSRGPKAPAIRECASLPS